MSDESAEPGSGRARWTIGLIVIAAGLVPMLGALDIGPLHSRDINGPPWLGFVASGMFVLGGLSVIFTTDESRRNHPLSWMLMFAIIAGFAAIADWIAFGVGMRQCSVGFSSFIFTSTRAAAEIECRVAFGIGALMMNGILVWLLGSGLTKLIPGSSVGRGIERLGQGVVLLALMPILLPLLLVMIVSSLIEVLRERYETGKWPRNEAFITRMKAKRAKRKPD